MDVITSKAFGGFGTLDDAASNGPIGLEIRQVWASIGKEYCFSLEELDAFTAGRVSEEYCR